MVLALFGALPFIFSGAAGFTDAYFETVSGLTTTGITIFTDIESLSTGILFWRSLIQWIGGLGILTLFLAVTFRTSATSFQLFSAESHKIDGARPTPSIFKTAVILWGLYIGFTVVELILLKVLGLSFFDALCHSLTTLSTGGFSTYDASIQHFKEAGYVNYRLIEYVITLFMFFGGCVGSTGGGFKVLRIAILWKAFVGQIRKLRLPRRALSEVVVDKSIVPDAELKRIAALFFGWLFLIAIGGFITSMFTDLNGWQSFSCMFSAVGNIGPCYISVAEMSQLPAIVKYTYIFGVLAGRLEILPVLLIFSRRVWR